MWKWTKRIVGTVVVLALLIVAGGTVYALSVGHPPERRPELATPLPEGVPPAPAGWPTEYTALAAGVLLHDLVPWEDKEPVQGVEQTLDLVYSEPGGKPLGLDLYRPATLESGERYPGLVLYYGGGWKRGRKDQLRAYAQYFAANGYVVAAVQYRLRREGLWPKSIHDAKAAVRWMRAHADEYQIDPKHIGVMGNSAGAYLALMVGYTAGIEEFEGDGGWPEEDSSVQAVVDIYGPTDFTEPIRRDHPLVVAYMDGTYEEDPTRFERASPIRYVDEGSPPTCIIHGTVDMLVPVHQSDWLVEKLREHNVPHHYSRIDGWPHAMDFVEEIHEHTRALALAFFDEYLKGEADAIKEAA